MAWRLPVVTEGVDVGSMRPGPNEHGQEAILEAAARAFMGSGYNGNSIDDIADLLGSTKGGIYHYFRRKADINLAVVSTVISGLRQERALEQVSAIRAAYERRFRDVVAEGIQEVEVRSAAIPLLGALNWLALWYRDDAEKVDAEQVATELATFVVHGLRWDPA